MDLNNILKIGESISREYTVKEEDTADYLGNKGITVLSTSAMIFYMELTASSIVFEKIRENYRPVGSRIDVKHINPAPQGSKIRVKATVKAIDGRKVTYDVEAFNEETKIGYGEYDLHIVDLNEFKNKF